MSAITPFRMAKQLFRGRPSELSKEEQLAVDTISAQDESMSSGVQPIVVSWNGNDADNPHNWPERYKILVLAVISLYSFVVYCGSSIILPSYEGVMLQFGKSREVTSLILALYVLGYGAGALLFSPISELAFIGRNPPYILSFAIFILISIILGKLENFPALVILRFWQGVFGSPGLATGGASVTDIYSGNDVAYGYTVWVACIYAGPALGPLLATSAVSHFSWHWPLWEIAMMAGPLFLVMAFFLPETSHDTILLRRAQRLRHSLGRQDILAPSEVRRCSLSKHFADALIRPVEIAVKDPAVGFVCLYCSFIYAVYYSFFESFPLVYQGVYGMSPVLYSAAFLAIIVGAAVAIVLYVLYMRYQARPLEVLLSQNNHEEMFVPALPAVVLATVGLFLFAWTARESINWAVSTSGIVLYTGSVFVIFQAVLLYIPHTYPSYVASLLAANDFTRSATASAMIVASQYMFDDLGISKGVSVLAGISVGGIIGMYILRRYGAQMRAASTFAVSEEPRGSSQGETV